MDRPSYQPLFTASAKENKQKCAYICKTLYNNYTISPTPKRNFINGGNSDDLVEYVNKQLCKTYRYIDSVINDNRFSGLHWKRYGEDTTIYNVSIVTSIPDELKTIPINFVATLDTPWNPNNILVLNLSDAENTLLKYENKFFKLSRGKCYYYTCDIETNLCVDYSETYVLNSRRLEETFDTSSIHEASDNRQLQEENDNGISIDLKFLKPTLGAQDYYCRTHVCQKHTGQSCPTGCRYSGTPLNTCEYLYRYDSTEFHTCFIYKQPLSSVPNDEPVSSTCLGPSVA